jgi:hypothetical protein
MMCSRYEHDVALYLEGDLSVDSAANVEAHLQECGACRGLLSELQESQRAVHDVAAMPLPEEALAAVRARVAHSSAQAAAHRPARLALAAGLAAAAIGAALWLGHPKQPANLVATGRTFSTPLPTTQPEIKLPATEMSKHLQSARSTLRAKTLVFLHEEQPPPMAMLSREDADQLAKAVVAVSRIDHVADGSVDEPSYSDAPPLARFQTDDPSIVIYWRLESNGGK